MEKRWTKKDIKTLQQQLMSFVLHNELYYPKGAIQAAIEKDRTTIVLNGLAGFRSLIAERSEQNKKTADHFEAQPTIYGDSTPEMVERFRRLHAECEADLKKIDRLVERVRQEGLPPEVASHMPAR